MTFYEQELRKIVGERYPDATYVGQSLLCPVGRDESGKNPVCHYRHRKSIQRSRLTVLNRQEGDVDNLLLRFSDLFGKKMVNNPNFRDGVIPHIWVTMER